MPTPRERVLLRLPSWLGDLVACEPVVRAFARRWAEDGAPERLTLAAPARLLALFDGRFEAARRLATDRGTGPGARAWRGHDLALLLDGSTRSAWRAFAAGIPRRVGFARGAKGLLLTDAIVPARELGATPPGLGRAGRFPRWLPRPFGSACAELAALLGVPVVDRAPRLEVDERARTEALARLARGGLREGEPFVLANAGSRPGSAKGLPPEVLARALDALAEELALPVVLACAPGEQARARETALRCARARTLLLDEPPSPLAELVALSSLARLVVGADGGARHVAVAVGTPVVAVCGPTDPRHTAEHLARTRVVRVEVPCGPCHREVCPIARDGERACFRRVDAGEVAAAALGLLRGPRPPIGRS